MIEQDDLFTTLMKCNSLPKFDFFVCISYFSHKEVFYIQRIDRLEGVPLLATYRPPANKNVFFLIFLLLHIYIGEENKDIIKIFSFLPGILSPQN